MGTGKGCSLLCPGHTVIAHDGHLGLVKDGQLLCFKGEGPEPCALAQHDQTECLFVSVKGHLHGPDCGHERVPHGDHWDYLVDGRLHHVIAAVDSLHEPQCCMRRCLGQVLATQVVDHGEVVVLRHGDPAACHAQGPDTGHASPPAANLHVSCGAQHAADSGAGKKHGCHSHKHAADSTAGKEDACHSHKHAADSTEGKEHSCHGHEQAADIAAGKQHACHGHTHAADGDAGKQHACCGSHKHAADSGAGKAHACHGHKNAADSGAVKGHACCGHKHAADSESGKEHGCCGHKHAADSGAGKQHDCHSHKHAADSGAGKGHACHGHQHAADSGAGKEHACHSHGHKHAADSGAGQQHACHGHEHAADSSDGKERGCHSHKHTADSGAGKGHACCGSHKHAADSQAGKEHACCSGMAAAKPHQHVGCEHTTGKLQTSCGSTPASSAASACQKQGCCSKQQVTTSAAPACKKQGCCNKKQATTSAAPACHKPGCCSSKQAATGMAVTAAALAAAEGKQACTQPQQLMPTQAGAAGLTTTRIVCGGICCPAEVPIITDILTPLAGVQSVEVHIVSKCVAVRHDPGLTPPGVLVSALNAAHLEATLRNPGSQAQVAEPLRPPLLVLLCGLLTIISLVSYGHHPGYLHNFKWVALPAVAIGIPPILLKAWVSLTKFRLDINVLMTVAVAGAIGLGDYVEAAGIVFLFSLAEWLEGRCVSRARAAITEVLQLQPTTALVLPSGGDTDQQIQAGRARAEGPELDEADLGTLLAGEEAPIDLASRIAAAEPMLIEEVGVGRLVVVRPGDAIPLDGRVEQGASAADEAMLTGETRLVPKRQGDELFGGTLNMGGGTLLVRTSAVASDSTVARLGALMEEAASQRSRRDTLVDTFAAWYTPAVVLAAAMVALIPSLVHMDDYQHWLYVALVLLVTACPCALVISTPVASVCGLARAARQGVIVKGSLHLERLGGVSTITFDKSGTLTQGHFQVVHAAAYEPTTAAAAAHNHRQSPGSQGHGHGVQAAAYDPTTTHAAAHGTHHGHGHVQALHAPPEAGQHALGQMELHALGQGEGTNSPLQAEMLALAAALEAHSLHPLAPAIIGYAAAKGADTGLKAQHVLCAPGLGLLGLVGGREVVVGSARLAINMLRSRTSNSSTSGSRSLDASSTSTTSSSIDTVAAGTAEGDAAWEGAAVSAAVTEWGAKGASVSFVVVDGRLVGVLAVRDEPRPHAQEAVQQLRARGVTCAMLTGDLTSTAQVVAGGLGLDPRHVHAQLLPADKLALVARYKQGAGAKAGPNMASHDTCGGSGSHQRGGHGHGHHASRHVALHVVHEEAGVAGPDMGGHAPHVTLSVEPPAAPAAAVPAAAAGAAEQGSSNSRGCGSSHGSGCGSGHAHGCGPSHGPSCGEAKADAGGNHAGGAKGWRCGWLGVLGGAKAKRPVALAHVGDGINDAPALAAADVGVAMGTSAAAITVAAADVVLFCTDLRALAFARDLGRRVTAVIGTNIGFALVTKVTVLVLAFVGYASLWLAVLVDVGSALLVVLHALTVLRFRQQLKPQLKPTSKPAGSVGEGGSKGGKAAGWLQSLMGRTPAAGGGGAGDCVTASQCGAHGAKACCSSKHTKQACCSSAHPGKGKQACCSPASGKKQACCSPANPNTGKQACCSSASSSKQACCAPANTTTGRTCSGKQACCSSTSTSGGKQACCSSTGGCQQPC